MISKTMQDAINKQINAELYSSYMYLAMAAYFESENLKGAAKWMRKQAQEENVHAMKFFDFINDRMGRVTLTAIDAPKTEWKSALEAFEEAFAHEQKVTGLINDLMTQAQKEKDHASAEMLQWFVKEQVEEEASADEVVNQLKMVGESKSSLLMIDHHLGKRE